MITFLKRRSKGKRNLSVLSTIEKVFPGHKVISNGKKTYGFASLLGCLLLFSVFLSIL